MRLVICHQVQLQQQEKEKENKEQTGFQRGTRTTKSLRVRGEDGRKGFFSSLFGGDWLVDEKEGKRDGKRKEENTIMRDF